MNSNSFGDLHQALTEALSRRGLLAVLSGALLTVPAFPLDISVTNARGHGKHRQKRKRRTRRTKRQPDPPLPPGPINTGGFLITTGDQRIAQTFTALRTGPLVQAAVEILKGPGSTGDYILRLGTVDAAGVPTNEVLAASVVADRFVTDVFSTLTFDFANPATVVAGTEYALVLTRPGSTQLEAIGTFDNPCAGRAFSSPSQTAPFVEDDEGFDMTFTTFVAS
jgi:hypothetical protein